MPRGSYDFEAFLFIDFNYRRSCAFGALKKGGEHLEISYTHIFRASVLKRIGPRGVLLPLLGFKSYLKIPEN